MCECVYLRLDQKSKCNKFFYAFCFYFRAYNYFSVVFISFMCYIRALFLTIPLAVVAAAVVLLLHFSSHFIHCESTCGILKYSEAKNGQIYLKTVMRMNITVSVNKSFFYNMECGDMCLCLFSSVSLVSLLASIFVAMCRSLHSWKCRNLWVCKVEYEKRLHNIKLSPSRPCVCVHCRRWLILIIQLSLLKWHAAGQF